MDHCFRYLLRAILGFTPTLALCQASLVIQPSIRYQQIDGFGAFQGGNEKNQAWWQNLFFDDLGASIYRVDLTPRLKSPYSDLNYYSPWFMGSSVVNVFNLEDPANPNGPDNNRVRTYNGPNTYSRLFGGRNAPIAVMGPDIEQNLEYFVFPPDGAIPAGISRQGQLGDFKLIGSFWSPLPWVKYASGNTYPQNWWPGPVQGTPWPFIWGGNFAGGKLDVSGSPLQVFDDSALGGTGPTSSLTQFARSCAAYVLGFQRHYNTTFYAISIQNELNFEQFYNSATYPLSSQYLAALKAIRAEFDKYPELAPIRIMGPEDLLGGDAYGLWQYGSGSSAIHKNLQYLQQIGLDPAAASALDFFCIHGYAPDGVSAAGASPQLWDWWANGWSSSPAPGIPGQVQGFRQFGKKSWLTETSGENRNWLHPNAGFPGNGAWSLALKIHQALTTGYQSAWIHWTLAETDNTGNITPEALTSQALGANSPKYVAVKHFFKYIRPNAYRVGAVISGLNTIQVSAFFHDSTGALTIVLVNSSNLDASLTLQIPDALPGAHTLDAFSSRNGQLWVPGTITLQNGSAPLTVPGYGVVTLTGVGAIPTSLAPGLPSPPAHFLPAQPNPVHGTARLVFFIETAQPVALYLSDLSGKTVKYLEEGAYRPGTHFVDASLEGIPAGVYFACLNAGGFVARMKLVVN